MDIENIAKMTKIIQKLREIQEMFRAYSAAAEGIRPEDRLKEALAALLPLLNDEKRRLAEFMLAAEGIKRDCR